MKAIAALPLLVPMLVTACAMGSPEASREPASEREYVTGSSIPRKQIGFRSDAKAVNQQDAQRFEEEMALRSARHPYTP